MKRLILIILFISTMQIKAAFEHKVGSIVIPESGAYEIALKPSAGEKDIVIGTDGPIIYVLRQQILRS